MDQKPRTVVHFKSEERRTVNEIADFLRVVADKLDTQGSFQIEQAGEQFDIRPEGNTKLELKYESKGERHKFEIEIEWKPGQEDKSFTIR
ncbi:hypothetical protein BHF68_07715 [Desulfuribacillus alkaliarsenatis]|uniref:Amphi-Trp domain-containing protein n=2 Tax=Desulfuribacillus alkaliarsenatis TaxID=766136 RepID=A0A1E5G156_9FIRM|nr:hypothetical protein BHF68_07715 [Desulfuribacillus alkaliarsenatis]